MVCVSVCLECLEALHEKLLSRLVVSLHTKRENGRLLRLCISKTLIPFKDFPILHQNLLAMHKKVILKTKKKKSTCHIEKAGKSMNADIKY